MSTSASISAGELFAFYGSLKQGAGQAPDGIHLEACGTFLGACYFRADMYDLGAYPAVIPGDTLCHAERYRVHDPDIVPVLDAYEGMVEGDERSLYVRRKTPLRDDHGTLTGDTAWIYWYNHPVDAARRIDTGVWPG